jgi:hypothetical protein
LKKNLVNKQVMKAQSNKHRKAKQVELQDFQEVSLAHLAREVDVQPSHPGSSPHRREFGFLFSKN